MEPSPLLYGPHPYRNLASPSSMPSLADQPQAAARPCRKGNVCASPRPVWDATIDEAEGPDSVEAGAAAQHVEVEQAR